MEVPIQTMPPPADTHPMPVGIAAIATVLAIAAIALLAAGHALASWVDFEIDLHNLRVEARRLKHEFERRRSDMLDAEAAHQGAETSRAA